MAKATFTFSVKEKEALSYMFFGHILHNIQRYKTAEEYIQNNLPLVTAMNKIKKGITSTPLLADYKTAHEMVRRTFEIHTL